MVLHPVNEDLGISKNVPKDKVICFLDSAELLYQLREG